MMMSPEMYYEENLRGRSQEEVLRRMNRSVQKFSLLKWSLLWITPGHTSALISTNSHC